MVRSPVCPLSRRHQVLAVLRNEPTVPIRFAVQRVYRQRRAVPKRFARGLPRDRAPAGIVSISSCGSVLTLLRLSRSFATEERRAAMSTMSSLPPPTARDGDLRSGVLAAISDEMVRIYK